MKKVAVFLRLFKQTLTNFQDNDPVRMAAATAFFTFFALPPSVIILSTVFSPVFNQQQVRGQVFRQLGQLFGYQSARQLNDISNHLQPNPSHFLWTALSVVLVLLASTALFMVIKNSLNQLWNVKATAERTILNTLKDRLVALGIIIFTGLLVTGSLALDQLASQVERGSILDETVNGVLSILFMAVWFAALFKCLPDLRVPWKAVWVGAFVTSLLYELGEALLGRLLVPDLINSRYGASGAFILLLLFVFYSSLIFYYGAVFTRQYTQWLHLDAQPKKSAVLYEITEISDSKKTP
ncbi:YihY/virulence factor BrkB family protein [Larkinella ripae]